VLAAERLGRACCVVALACVAASEHAKDRGNALPLDGAHGAPRLHGVPEPWGHFAMIQIKPLAMMSQTATIRSYLDCEGARIGASRCTMICCGGALPIL
jgi:hypothetical protein